MTKAERYANRRSYLSFYEAVLCPLPESLRFRVQRAFRNPVIAECDWKGNLCIRKPLRLKPQEAVDLARWLNSVFIEDVP